jgi:hypothetical protein
VVWAIATFWLVCASATPWSLNCCAQVAPEVTCVVPGVTGVGVIGVGATGLVVWANAGRATTSGRTDSIAARRNAFKVCEVTLNITPAKAKLRLQTS